jgi:RNA polymerase-binding transcription factor DksA
MTPMVTPSANIPEQPLDRREHLAALVDRGDAGPQLEALLREVDQAVGRATAGTYGLCETCGERVEADRLTADPLARFCLDDSTVMVVRRSL